MRSDYKEANRPNSKKKGIKVIVIIAVILVIGVASILIYINGLGEPLDTANTEMVSVTIEPGSATGQIGQTLVEDGIIDNMEQFKLWSRIKGYDSQYQAGTYSLSPSMSYEEIAKIIVGGAVDTFTFTIPEGYTIKQVAETLSQDGYVDKETFMKLLESDQFDYDFLKDAQQNENHLEGYLFPNTYTMKRFKFSFH